MTWNKVTQPTNTTWTKIEFPSSSAGFDVGIFDFSVFDQPNLPYPWTLVTIPTNTAWTKITTPA